MSTSTKERPAKRAWNTVPAEPLPLRETLPKIGKDTRDRLIAWASRQPDVMSWLFRRTAAYWERLMESGDAGAGSLPEIAPEKFDDLHVLTDATAALDLLEWQSGCRGKAAVEWLDGLDEAGVAVANDEAQPRRADDARLG